MNVPSTVRVKGIAEVQRVIVLVDRNPIRKVLEYQLVAALPVIGFRFKLEQASHGLDASDGRRPHGQEVFKLAVTSSGFAGAPQAIDLNRISAPPARTDVPRYSAAQRDDIPPAARWFNKITIE